MNQLCMCIYTHMLIYVYLCVYDYVCMRMHSYAYNTSKLMIIYIYGQLVRDHGNLRARSCSLAIADCL